MVLNDFLYSVAPNTMLLGLLFIIFYIFINFSLSKIFREERASSAIISLCVSLLAVYGINRTSLDISGIFSSIGISEELIYAVVPWLIIGLAILGSFVKDKITGRKRFRLYRLFIILGAFLIILSFFAYEQTVLLIAGIALILIGLFLLWKSKKKGTLPPQVGTNGSDALIAAAKKFKDWAKRQSNPRFVGSWASFINYLKRGGWVGSEAEICNRLRISQNDFVRIFNKYGRV
jgi:LPXTG-motif cell wall-anchored protein